MTFDVARAIADAVLLEGYVLYPYRASSRKNQFRFAFGTLAPRSWSEAGGCEPFWMKSECLVEGEAPRVCGQLRFLSVVRRTVEEVFEGGFRPCAALDTESRRYVAWDEGELHELPLPEIAGEEELTFSLPGGREEELVSSGGRVVGRVARTKAPIELKVRLSIERVEPARALHRLSLRIENVSAPIDPSATRDAILVACCTSTHLLLAVQDGAFVSLLDPPEGAREAAAACENVRCYPVLAGLEGAANKVWHGHPVWFLDDNPIVGYSLEKKGVRLMFWSGADFDEPALDVRGGKFRDASVSYREAGEVDVAALRRWLGKARDIQWDYRNLARRKGRLERLR